MYFINGTYYLLIAEGKFGFGIPLFTDPTNCLFLAGGTDLGHRVTVQRGPSPSGPWENNPANPILFNGIDLTNEVQVSMLLL